MRHKEFKTKSPRNQLLKHFMCVDGSEGAVPPAAVLDAGVDADRTLNIQLCNLTAKLGKIMAAAGAAIFTVSNILRYSIFQLVFRRVYTIKTMQAIHLGL